MAKNGIVVVGNPHTPKSTHTEPYDWHERYYRDDCRVGTFVTINDKDVYSLYNADLYDMTMEPAGISKTMVRDISRSGMKIYGFEYGVGTMTLGFYVGGYTREDASNNVNQLLIECGEHCTVRSQEYEYIFDCSLVGVSNYEYTDVPCYYDVQLTFDAVKHLALEEFHFSGHTGTVNNIGSIKSGMRLSFVSPRDYTDLWVDCVHVKNVLPDTAYVVDGLTGKVTVDGVSAVEKVDFFEFPKISPGVSTITATQHVNCTIQWYPTFIL